jgi:hypothetical protein
MKNINIILLSLLCVFASCKEKTTKNDPPSNNLQKKMIFYSVTTSLSDSASTTIEISVNNISTTTIDNGVLTSGAKYVAPLYTDDFIDISVQPNISTPIHMIIIGDLYAGGIDSIASITFPYLQQYQFTASAIYKGYYIYFSN